MDRKVILVTGGAGFIGSNLCRALSQDNSLEVFSLDNYTTGSENNHVPGVNYIRGDTQQIDDLVNVKPNVIYHLGEYSRVEQSFNALDKVWSSNMTGTYEVVKFCNKANAKLVYAGSSTKFIAGDNLNELSPYTWTKAKNTEFIINFGLWYGLEYAISYFYNAYGPNEMEQGEHATLIGIYKRLSKTNIELPVVSPGTQRRNFTHVDDIVSGLILVGDAGIGDGYGIGSDESYTVIEVAKMFGGDIEMLPPRRGNRNSAPLFVDKTKKLGWTAKWNLAEYIKGLKAAYTT